MVASPRRFNKARMLDSLDIEGFVLFWSMLKTIPCLVGCLAAWLAGWLVFEAGSSSLLLLFSSSPFFALSYSFRLSKPLVGQSVHLHTTIQYCITVALECSLS